MSVSCAISCDRASEWILSSTSQHIPASMSYMRNFSLALFFLFCCSVLGRLFGLFVDVGGSQTKAQMLVEWVEPVQLSAALSHCQVTKILDWILPSRQAHSRQSYVCVCALYDFYAFRSIHSRQVCSYLTVYQWKIFIFHFAFSSCVDSFSCFFFLARFRQSHSCLGDCVIVDKSDSVTLLYVYICSIMFTVAVCGHINLQYSGFGCACVCVCVWYRIILFHCTSYCLLCE